MRRRPPVSGDPVLPGPVRRLGGLGLRVAVGAALVYAAAGYGTSRLTPAPPLLPAAPTGAAPVPVEGSTLEVRRVACPGPDPRCGALFAGSEREVLGVSSVHTERSGDAEGTFAEVGQSGRRAGLDFVLLGDHAGPWLTGLEVFEPRREAGVLLIPGQELVVDGVGRTLAIGLDTVVARWQGDLAALVDRVDGNAGFLAVVHPRSPRGRERWHGVDAPGVHGWEALDVSEQARTRLGDRWAAYHLTSFLAGMAGGWAHTSVLRLNREGLQAPGLMAYDSARVRTPVTLLAALNHHPKLRMPWGLLPGYTPFFRTYVNHVVGSGPLPADPGEARARVLSGLRSGRVFVSLGSADEARGFRLSGWTAGAGVAMGQAAPWTPGSELVVHLPPGAGRRLLVRILADGGEVGWVTGRPGETLAVGVDRPGVWRVEVLRAGVGLGPVRFDARPWLLSNPVAFTDPRVDRLARR